MFREEKVTLSDYVKIEYAEESQTKLAKEILQNYIERTGDNVMKYIIYMDVFFIVNLVMDTVLLKLASLLIKPQTTFIRCLAGAAVGSLLTCLSLLLSYENMVVHMLISYIFIVTVIVLVTYGKCSGKQILKRAGWLYLVTILMGGAMNLVYDYTYFGYVLRGIFSAVYANPVNLFRMCTFTGVSYMILLLLIKFINYMKTSSELVMVRIDMKGESVVLKGLIDTGNSLKDPYFGKNVHIAECEALQRILEGVDIHQEKYRLVPFHSLGKKNGLVEVIEFDEIEIWDYDNADSEADSKKNVIYMEKKPAIGLYHGSLSCKKEYEVLLNRVVGSYKSQV